MQVTDKIRNKSKSLQSVQSSATPNSDTRSYPLIMTNTCVNIFLSHIIGSTPRTMISISCHWKREVAQFIKKEKYFGYREKSHTTYNCFKKWEITTILESISKDSDNPSKE